MAWNPIDTITPDLLVAPALEQHGDALAIRVDGPRAWGAELAVRFA